tara:strand:+ start:82 stop:465 length:384 start_codon:yes stop_codon:yes gene_type:complete
MTANKKVLVIDDSATMRSLIKTTLNPINVECASASDGQAALKSVKMEKFDLIICDVNMPNMDGIEFVQHARKDDASLNKETPVLMVTTENSDMIKGSGKEAGASGWLTKPFNPEILIKASKKLMGMG